MQDWEKYEHQAVEYHNKKYNQKTWHWKVLPEEHLYKAGFITRFNKFRLERLAKFKENKNRFNDYGLDGLALDNEGNYHGLQMKKYKRSVRADDIGTFFSVIFNRLWKNNVKSKGY